MIVQRFTLQYKNGKWDELVELAKDGMKNVFPFFSTKFYSMNYGPMNTFVFDNEFEDMAELEKLWEQLSAKEEWGLWLAKLDELTTEEGKAELLTLEVS